MSDKPDEVPPTSVDLAVLYDEFYALGKAAYPDRPAPILSVEVQAALAGNPVGDPRNASILGGYSDGWQDAARVAMSAELRALGLPS